MMDKGKTALFSEKISQILNYGALNLAMGIGYEAGLFETLASFGDPAGCSKIAAEAQVDQRYLYEWLGVMCAGEIVEVTGVPDSELFFLPREHVPFLCRSGGNSNLGVYTQEIPMLTLCAMEGVSKGMKSGEGLPYAAYPNFYDFMEQLSEAKHRGVFIDVFLPSVMDGEIVKQMELGCCVCDLGCGGGVAVELMASAFPRSNFTGMDISGESIRDATARVKRLGLANISFELVDAAGSDVPQEKFDYILAFDSIHDQTNPAGALKNVYEMLKVGGCFSMIDIDAESAVSLNKDHPMGPFLYTVSLMHCMPVGLMDKGSGLGMMWGREKAVSMCREAGFDSVEVHQIPQDGFNVHYLCKK